MKTVVRNLPDPINATRADWLAGTTWLGFTPKADSQVARDRCQATIQRQFGRGYVIEYITEQFGEPNPGFENDPSYRRKRAEHKALAGRLVSVHRLRATAHPLEAVIGRDEYRRLEDMWARDGRRHRWSVAFPIVETYRILGQPKARDVFGEAAYRRLYQRSSAILRVLDDSERSALADLELEAERARNAWIGIEDEIAIAEESEIEPRLLRLVSHDLTDRALEGVSDERRIKLRRRAAWLAARFIRQRQSQGRLACDECRFDPAKALDPRIVNPRALLDVHHKHPLEEGERYTNVGDFTLLCPTCHRVEHQKLKFKMQST